MRVNQILRTHTEEDTPSTRRTFLTANSEIGNIVVEPAWRNRKGTESSLQYCLIAHHHEGSIGFCKHGQQWLNIHRECISWYSLATGKMLNDMISRDHIIKYTPCIGKYCPRDSIYWYTTISANITDIIRNPSLHRKHQQWCKSKNGNIPNEGKTSALSGGSFKWNKKPVINFPELPC